MAKKTVLVPEVNKIYSVTGGYGLVKVVEVDLAGPKKLHCVRVHGHGLNKTGIWFRPDRLRGPYGAEAVLREREQARARNVGCNSPDCWCREFDSQETRLVKEE